MDGICYVVIKVNGICIEEPKKIFTVLIGLDTRCLKRFTVVLLMSKNFRVRERRCVCVCERERERARKT